MKTTIIVPAKDELVAMKQIMPRIKKDWYDQLIVVDGNSVDGTLEWCEMNGYEVFRQRECGLWNAYEEVFASGIIKGDIVVTFSPDGNSIPELIPELINKMAKGYDMVIVSRYKGNARSYDDTVLTKLGNRVFSVMVNVLCKSNYTDFGVIYRAYKTDLVYKLALLGEMPIIYKWLLKISLLTSWEIPLAIRCAREQMVVGEIEGDEPPNIVFKGGRRENVFTQGFAMLCSILYETGR